MRAGRKATGDRRITPSRQNKPSRKAHKESNMRQIISGVVAAVAVMVTAPAMACGGYPSPCGQTFAPAPVYSHCHHGCGAAYERLPDPVHQYYYVNQGPTYSGPGNFAPYPTYQESAVSGWSAYRHRPYYYGYDGGRYADATTHYYDGAPVAAPLITSYRPRFLRRHARRGMRYGMAPQRVYSQRVMRERMMHGHH